MAKRLSEKDKEEITQGFKDGKTIDFLSNDFNCNKLTIIRNLKKNLGEVKYKELINNKDIKTKGIITKIKLKYQMILKKMINQKKSYQIKRTLI